MSVIKRTINLGVSEGFTSFLPLVYYPILLSKLGVNNMGGLVINQVFISFGLILVSAGLRVNGPTRILSINEIREKNAVFTNILGLNIIVLIIVFLFAFVLSFLKPLSLGLVLMGITGAYFNGNWFYIAFNRINLYRNMQLTFQLCYGFYIYYLMPVGESDLKVLLLKSTIQAGIGLLFLIRLKSYFSPSMLSLKRMRILLGSSFHLVFTDYVNNVKDKFHFLLLGFVGKQELATFVDGGIKLLTMVQKPLGVVSIAYLGVQDRNNHRRKVSLIFAGSVGIYLLMLPFTSSLVASFMSDLAEAVSVYKYFLLSVIPLSLSGYIVNNILIYNNTTNVVLQGSIVVTSIYLLLIIGITTVGLLNYTSILYVIMSSYIIEFLYYILLAGLWKK